MTTITATYSPDDNKLRLTASSRLDRATYERVKAAGFSWAPKLEQFIAPMWTPARADLAIELAGEIEDDDGSLIDRAEVRAERFGEYEEKRGAEAVRARDYVASITDGIPFGQPILVGHHSQRHAERDAKRIESGMRRAVDAFETAEYWKRRAAAAISHAKYKERADVRHRRIKGLEADQRKHRKEHDTGARFLRLWQTAIDCGAGWKAERADGTPTTPRSRCMLLANLPGACDCGLYSALDADKITPEEAQARAIESLTKSMQWAARWLDHIGNRLTYERAMLDEGGGIVAEQYDIQPGGRVLIGAEWCVVLRVNKSAGRVVSVTTTARYVSVRGIEEVKGYREPAEGDTEKVAAVSKLAPLCNYRADGCREMTADEWKSATRHSDSYFVEKVKATPEAVEHRRRSACSSAGGWVRMPVFITDAKETRPPAPGDMPKGHARGPWNSEPKPAAEPVTFAREIEPAELPPVPTQSAPVPGDTRAEFKAMRDSLRAGVQVVSAPQLFPTPPELARRMVELADIESGMTVLEPSAGTGRIVEAIIAAVDTEIVGYEIDVRLCAGLARFPGYRLQARRADFLTVTEGMGQFPRVIMNPPFANGADVAHVTHAVKFLRPGGRLVAIMSAGVTFRDDRKTREFRRLILNSGGTIEALPSGTFESSGTGVNTVLVVYDAPGQPVAVAHPAQAALI